MTWNEIFHIGFDSVMMIIRAMLPIYVNIEKSTIFVRVLGSWADVQPKYHSIPLHTIFTILRYSTQISFNPCKIWLAWFEYSQTHQFKIRPGNMLYPFVLTFLLP